jgi:hypothetical protein
VRQVKLRKLPDRVQGLIHDGTANARSHFQSDSEVK